MIMIITIYISNIYKEQYYINLSILKNCISCHMPLTMASAQSAQILTMALQALTGLKNPNPGNNDNDNDNDECGTITF